MNSQLLLLVESLPITVVVLGLLWFSMDMSSILRWMRRKNELSIEGRWRELEQHFERGMKPRRPFVWLHRRCFIPGGVAAQYGLFLYKQGRLEEALAKADEAIRQINRKPAMFRFIYRSAAEKTLRSAFHSRTLILTGLGRYDEARQSADQLEKLFGPKGPVNAALVLLDYYCGDVDRALAQAQAVGPEDTQYDSMRGVVVLTLCTKGEFDQAQQALAYEAADASKFHTPSNFNRLNRSGEGAKLIESQQRELAGLFKPIQWLLMAQVYIARKEFANADSVLNEAERSMGSEPGLQVSYCRHRAWSLAGQGKASETENYLVRLREIARQDTRRSFQFEKHYVAARAYLYLGRFREALFELTQAKQFVLHPIEKHYMIYYTALAYEGAGDRSNATACYQAVAADTIPSWMRKSAAEAIARRNG